MSTGQPDAWHLWLLKLPSALLNQPVFCFLLLFLLFLILRSFSSPPLLCFSLIHFLFLLPLHTSISFPVLLLSQLLSISPSSFCCSAWFLLLLLFLLFPLLQRLLLLFFLLIYLLPSMNILLCTS